METLRKLIKETIVNMLEDDSNFDYKKWKRKNVTIRGMKEVGKENVAGAMLGDGLYTAALSNRSLAKQYGDVHFAVNAKPKNPIVFNDLNRWEIWLQTLMYKTLGYKNAREFYKNTDIATEVQKLGYDGVIIKGREMVNYKPENVMYFKTEQELENWAYNSFESGDIKESYDDVGVDYIINKLPKLQDVKKPYLKKKFKNFTLIGFKYNKEEIKKTGLLGYIKAYNNDDGTEIGNSTYGKDYDGGVLKATIDVRSDFRRKGIATEIYKFIEEIAGEVIYPEPKHSDSAEKFWNQLDRPFGPKNKT